MKLETVKILRIFFFINKQGNINKYEFILFKVYTTKVTFGKLTKETD